MVSRGRREEIIPSAARLLGSLRDLGYEFVNAVADLIDNSISAGADRVEITIKFDGPDSWVRIADNGTGMSTAMISEAMRLGSGGRDYGADDLGKFGLGLKTASLSQARSITVASRSHPTRRHIDCRQLDLDEVIDTDRWEIAHPTAADRPAAVVEPLQEGTGTVVLWTKLDRILSLNDPFGGWAHRHLLRLAQQLDLHLGMVFGRFLTGQARRHGPVCITVNGTPVDAWDPFCLDQSTQHLPQHELQVAGGVVRYQPYVLPPQRDFNNDEAWKRASGPNQWNRQQGLYIYRADRMIQSGGWSWLRTADEHVKLARAAVDFWPDLDEAFEINISKMRVKLPEELRDQMKPMVSLLSRVADDRYRKSSRNSAQSRTAARPSRAAPSTGTGSGNSTPTTARPHATDPVLARREGSTFPDFDASRNGAIGNRADDGGSGGHAGVALERAAERAGALEALRLIRDELTWAEPGVARELGW